MQVVHAQSVVLEWKLYPSRGASSVGQHQQDSPLPLPRWISAAVHIDNPQISYTAKVTTPTLLHLSICKPVLHPPVVSSGVCNNSRTVHRLWLAYCLVETTGQSSVCG